MAGKLGEENYHAYARQPSSGNNSGTIIHESCSNSNNNNNDNDSSRGNYNDDNNSDSDNEINSRAPLACCSSQRSCSVFTSPSTS